MPAPAPPGIGPRLRQARENRSLSIEETAWRTRIRPDVLRALEREQFSALEHQGFVRSLLSSYARFLGLEPKEIVRDYHRRYGAAPSPVEELEKRERNEEKPPRPKWVLAATVSALLLIAAGVLGLVGGQDEQLASAPRITEPAAASRGGAVRVTVRLEATEDSQVSVKVDGRRAFEGVLRAGRAKSFGARNSVDVMIGTAGAVRLRVNGRDLGAPGEPGSVYRARFGPGEPST